MQLYNTAVRSIVIVGAGELGGALARQIAAARIASTIVLVDEAGKVAEGKALDIMQAAPIDGYTSALSGTSDESTAVTADAIVIADRHAAASVEWQDEPGLALIRRVAQLNPRAMILCAGARQLSLIDRAVHESGLAAARIVGSAAEAFRSAVVSIAALEAGCDPGDVCLTVVGRPPNQIIVPWDEGAVAGRRATEVLSPPAITRLDARLPRLWPPGPLALASAATEFLRAAATRSRRTLCAIVAATAVDQPRTTGMLPVTIGAGGGVTIVAPTLSTRDRVRLQTALSR
jgi:malate/lactate dehydrogenase